METFQTIITNVWFLMIGMLIAAAYIWKKLSENEMEVWYFCCDNCHKIRFLHSIWKIKEYCWPIWIIEDEHIPKPIPQNFILCQDCINYQE